MTKKVLSIGQCSFDNSSIGELVRKLGAELVAAHNLNDALAVIQRSPVDLIMVNRKLDRDHADGLEIIKAIRSDARTKDITVMMVSNYPEAQQSAVEAGAVQGFGKASMYSEETQELLNKYLE